MLDFMKKQASTILQKDRSEQRTFIIQNQNPKNSKCSRQSDEQGETEVESEELETLEDADSEEDESESDVDTSERSDAV